MSVIPAQAGIHDRLKEQKGPDIATLFDRLKARDDENMSLRGAQQRSNLKVISPEKGLFINPKIAVFSPFEPEHIAMTQCVPVKKFHILANSQQPTANSQQPTANSQQP